MDLRHDTGADRLAVFADREPETRFARDHRHQLDVDLMLSPGITISVPAGSVTVPGASVVRK